MGREYLWGNGSRRNELVKLKCLDVRRRSGVDDRSHAGSLNMQTAEKNAVNRGAPVEIRPVKKRNDSDANHFLFTRYMFIWFGLGRRSGDARDPP